MEKNSSIEIVRIVNESGCFDLQFRKDVRRERTNSPTYYRWKIQFIITVPKEKKGVLLKIKNIVGCGKIYFTGNQPRFSVQKINDIAEFIIPFLKKSLSGNKKRDFELWRRSVEIINGNKGKQISKWKKSDLFSLIEIHKTMAKYKNRNKKEKWLDMAKTIAQSLKS